MDRRWMLRFLANAYLVAFIMGAVCVIIYSFIKIDEMILLQVGGILTPIIAFFMTKEEVMN